METEAPPELLVVVLDLDFASWHSANPALLPSVIEHVLLFIDAFMAQHPENSVSVLAAHPLGLKWLYPMESASMAYRPADVYAPFHRIRSAVVHGIRGILSQGQNSGAVRAATSMAAALSSSLCCNFD